MVCLPRRQTLRIKWWGKKTVDIRALMELGFSRGARHLSNHHTHNCETATMTGAPNGKCVGGWRQVEDRNVT